MLIKWGPNIIYQIPQSSIFNVCVPRQIFCLASFLLQDVKTQSLRPATRLNAADRPFASLFTLYRLRVGACRSPKHTLNRKQSHELS